jgi:S-disulfanyl-L-cysteine oxidoreductase SoxD
MLIPVLPARSAPTKMIAVLLIAIGSMLASVWVIASAATSARSTKEGAFTAEQADRGKLVYETSCKNCHQPEFYSERLTRYNNRSIDALFQSVSTTMPADNVGNLLTSQYVDVLAYIFSLTGSPAGSEELSTETMEGIKIVAP